MVRGVCFCWGVRMRQLGWRGILRLVALLFLGAVAAEFVGPAALNLFSEFLNFLIVWLVDVSVEVTGFSVGTLFDGVLVVCGLVGFAVVVLLGNSVVRRWRLSHRMFRSGTKTRRKVIVMGCSPKGDPVNFEWFKGCLGKESGMDVALLLSSFGGEKATSLLPDVDVLMQSYEAALEQHLKEKAGSEADNKDACSKQRAVHVCDGCGAEVLCDGMAREPAEERKLPVVSWQQSCRLLYHMWRQHQAIEKIIIIPSRHMVNGSDIGKKTADEFKEFLHFFLGRVECATEIEVLPHTVNYEDLEKVEAAIDRAREKARSLGFSDRDICVDVTAGQKTFSIAASNATLRSEIIFAYVPTTKPEAIEDLTSVVGHYRPMYFDLVPITNDAT